MKIYGMGFFFFLFYFLRRFRKFLNFFENLVFLKNYYTDFQKGVPIGSPPTHLCICILS